MAGDSDAEIVLYDLSCTKNVCLSPAVWPIRMMLAHKQIPYKTVFLEFPDIEPTLKELGIVPGEAAAQSVVKYTVPAIRHVPTNTCMMESTAIAQFLESTYPDPPLPLKSELGSKIEAKNNAYIMTFLASLMPREIHILSPRSQEYYKRTREQWLGHPLEDMLNLETEDESWNAHDNDMREASELMMTNNSDGPFVLGAKPSYTDFSIAGLLQCAKVIDEGVFQRHMKYPGYKTIYEACLPYMGRQD